jgi:predicted Rossmann fold flavoprotein
MSETPSANDCRKSLTVAVIGGGAGGFFAAVNIAEKNPLARVTIFEATPAPLRKVLISGGGRCNLTHACFDPARLAEFYPRGGRELRSLFARFQPRDTVRWFEARGLPLKAEADGRVFPVSDSSQSVVDVLLDAARRFGVRLRTGVRIARIDNIGTGQTNGGFTEGRFDVVAGGKPERFDVCVLSTGYSPPGWQLAAGLGHTVLPPVPSLFPFTVASPVIAGLQGISLPHAAGRLRRADGDGRTIGPSEEGALLITHTGLSGPLIYRLSARSARELSEMRYRARIRLDLLPEQSEDAVRDRLARLWKSEDARKKLGNTRFEPFPQRLWLSLLAAAGLDPEQRAETVNTKILNRMTEILKRLELPVTGKSPSKEEFVSCGGVARKEVDFRTMQSRRVPGLYFAGEILDIDGLTGGFNFQACWSAGWVISEALASAERASDVD